MKTWILVANSSEAKLLFSESLRTKELELLQEFSHPKSRKKVSEIVSDKPGHYKTDTGSRGSYSKNDPKEVEADHFALELAGELKAAKDKNNFEKLLVAAPANFQGLLKNHLHLAGNIEITYITKDYTKYGIKELQEVLIKHTFG